MSYLHILDKGLAGKVSERMAGDREGQRPENLGGGFAGPPTLGLQKDVPRA